MTDQQVAPTSRNMPLPIQREVRQRCGFGCVVCGLPLYEYDHLLGWTNVCGTWLKRSRFFATSITERRERACSLMR